MNPQRDAVAESRVQHREAQVEVIPIVDEGLGNSSYLVDLGDGRALAVDPSRDPEAYSTEAARRRFRIAFAAETHLHADFVSGARELAARGATILGSADGRREFDHRPLRFGDEIDLGGLRLRALATPGHTPEHLAYLILDGSRPAALFTGGSLLVGAVARTDLVSPERTEELARAMYRSVHMTLLSLPDELAVYPTHGAGSFCAAPPGGDRTTTIGRERATNPLLAEPDEDSFVRRLLGGLGTYPPYFLRLQEVNRRGPGVLGRIPELRRLDVPAVRRLVEDGVEIVDVRPISEFAAGHIPGALSIELRPAFATWLGWLAAPQRPLVFIVGDGQDRIDLVRQALTIGYENIAGELDGGMDAWRAAGGDERGTPLLLPAAMSTTAIVDVRQRAEYEAGHLPGAVSVELGSLAAASTALPTRPLTVMCGHGERAMSAASVLERAGRADVSALRGGPDEWVSAVRGRATVVR